MYPVSLAVQANAGGSGTGEGSPSTSHWEIPKLSLSDWVSNYSDSLPAPVSEWITQAVASGEEPAAALRTKPWKPYSIRGQADDETVHA